MRKYSWGSQYRKSCIALTVDEFRELLDTIYKRPVSVDVDADGLYIGFLEDDGTELPIEDIHKRLAEKFDVDEVTSIHIDDYEPPLIWIVYRDSRVSFLDGESGLAKLCTRAVNSFSFNYKEFCKAMALEHKTLQQSFTRLCLAWIRHCAELEDWQIDGRNEFSVKVCRMIAKALDEEGIGGVPMI